LPKGPSPQNVPGGNLPPSHQNVPGGNLPPQGNPIRYPSTVLKSLRLALNSSKPLKGSVLGCLGGVDCLPGHFGVRGVDCLPGHFGVRAPWATLRAIFWAGQGNPIGNPMGNPTGTLMGNPMGNPTPKWARPKKVPGENNPPPGENNHPPRGKINPTPRGKINPTKCGASPGDLGVPGVGFGQKPMENRSDNRSADS